MYQKILTSDVFVQRVLLYGPGWEVRSVQSLHHSHVVTTVIKSDKLYQQGEDNV
jgi:hypothetical protein